MADTVIWQGVDDDELSEEHLALMLALGNQADYVERGYSLDPDFSTDTLDVGTATQWGNLAIVEDGNKAYYLLADRRTDLGLDPTATNHVYLEHDPTVADDIQITINTTGNAPTNPSLKLGEVDAVAQTKTELNRDPDVSAESLSGDVVGGNTVTDLLGSGLEFASGSLKAALGNGLTFASGAIALPTSIYNNGNIVADVVNSSVSTDQIQTTGQSWNGVTGSRSFDTWYQAPSDRDIRFTVQAKASADSTNINLTADINDSQSNNIRANPIDTVSNGDAVQTPSMVIPAGHYYKVRQFGDTGSYSLNVWSEFR